MFLNWVYFIFGVLMAFKSKSVENYLSSMHFHKYDSSVDLIITALNT